MLLLIGLLFYKRLPKPLEDTAQVLLQNMMLLFIPVIAGVMLEFGLRREWLPFVLACVAGAAITFLQPPAHFHFFLLASALFRAAIKITMSARRAGAARMSTPLLDRLHTTWLSLAQNSPLPWLVEPEYAKKQYQAATQAQVKQLYQQFFAMNHAKFR